MTVEMEPRRKQTYWWQLPTPPKCPHCNLICVTNGTVITKGGKKIQNRYCPKCRHGMKTTVQGSE